MLLLSLMLMVVYNTAKEHLPRRLLQQGEHLLMLLTQAFLSAILLNLVVVAYLKSPAALDTPTSQDYLEVVTNLKAENKLSMISKYLPSLESPKPTSYSSSSKLSSTYLSRQTAKPIYTFMHTFGNNISPT
jgi:hypothetical protein